MCSCSERGQQAGQKAIPKTSLSLPICHTQLVMTIANIFWPKLIIRAQRFNEDIYSKRI